MQSWYKMVKAIKDSEQIIVSCSLDGKTNKVMFYVKHKDVTNGQIPVGEDTIKEFMVKIARLKEYCKLYKIQLKLKTYEQIMKL